MSLQKMREPWDRARHLVSKIPRPEVVPPNLGPTIDEINNKERCWCDGVAVIKSNGQGVCSTHLWDLPREFLLDEILDPYAWSSWCGYVGAHPEDGPPPEGPSIPPVQSDNTIWEVSNIYQEPSEEDSGPTRTCCFCRRPAGITNNGVWYCTNHLQEAQEGRVPFTNMKSVSRILRSIRPPVNIPDYLPSLKD